MAQQVVTKLVDDITGEAIEDGKGRTVTFAFDGINYEIDLADKQAKKFDDAMDYYITHARKVSGGGARQRRSSSAPRTSGGRSKEDLANMRAWLREQGHEVNDRGRIKQELQDLYDNANK